MMCRICCQFHQYQSFYSHRSQKCRKTACLTVFFALLGSAHLKALCKILVKSTPGVNFINILRAAFAPVDPKSVQRYLQLDWILTLLWATLVKASRKILVKSAPDLLPIDLCQDEDLDCKRHIQTKIIRGVHLLDLNSWVSSNYRKQNVVFIDILRPAFLFESDLNCFYLLILCVCIYFFGKRMLAKKLIVKCW